MSHLYEKYREIDEDAILSNLTAAELEQLEVKAKNRLGEGILQAPF